MYPLTVIFFKIFFFIFVAVHGPSLVEVNRGYSVAVLELLTAVASLVEHVFYTHGFSSCSA